MNTSELIAEGKSIAKPCLLLSAAEEGGVVGYWGGERADIPNTLPEGPSAYESRRHVVTVSEKAWRIAGSENSGAISLFSYFLKNGLEQLRVEYDPDRQLDAIECTGEALYGREFLSFPPLEALCLHGSERIGEWLSFRGLRRHEYGLIQRDSSGVPREVIEEYRQHWMRHCPFFIQDRLADVILGGWHMMWPEDDYYTPPELTHLLLTLRDAEPWYSVWHSPISHGFRCRAHVS